MPQASFGPPRLHKQHKNAYTHRHALRVLRAQEALRALRSLGRFFGAGIKPVDIREADWWTEGDKDLGFREIRVKSFVFLREAQNKA